ncbi:Clp protease N-terminal domain-containing protein [Nonomuraea sp. NPDC023979]|uniref:Clp protease N-terminal domain-containing protein n=1 Tax=Nonomuraea sp. NPDC023979 TaxID=3154796 RepID=UPI0033D59ACB
MFERFTESSRQVVVLAREEARAMRHGAIGTGHLLLGLVREGEGPAARVLAECGVSLEGVRACVEAEEPRRDPAGHAPFTARAKRVLELSLREALGRRHDFIGTGHVLLGLLRDGDAPVLRALAAAGADPDEVRQRVLEEVGRREPPGDASSVSAPELAGRLARIEESLERIERHLGIRRTGSD